MFRRGTASLSYQPHPRQGRCFFHLSSDGTAFYDGHISSANATKLSQVVRQLTSASSFGSVAQTLSDDSSKPNMANSAALPTMPATPSVSSFPRATSMNSSSVSMPTMPSSIPIRPQTASWSRRPHSYARCRRHRQRHHQRRCSLKEPRSAAARPMAFLSPSP